MSLKETKPYIGPHQFSVAMMTISSFQRGFNTGLTLLSFVGLLRNRGKERDNTFLPTALRFSFV